MKNLILAVTVLLASCVETRSTYNLEEEHEALLARVDAQHQAEMDEFLKEMKYERYLREQFFNAIAEWEGDDFNYDNTKLFFWNYSDGMSFVKRFYDPTPPEVLTNYVWFDWTINSHSKRQRITELLWNDYITRVN